MRDALVAEAIGKHRTRKAFYPTISLVYIIYANFARAHPEVGDRRRWDGHPPPPMNRPITIGSPCGRFAARTGTDG